MIALKHITDERTGVTYYVDKMVLVSDGDGYADHEDTNGMNMYEIDLQPYSEDEEVILNLSLAVRNDGTVFISENLDAESNKLTEIYFDDGKPDTLIYNSDDDYKGKIKELNELMTRLTRIISEVTCNE